MESRSPEQALVDAVTAMGSQAALAKLCGVAQPSVHKWIRAGKALPAEHVLAVEAATGISRHELRPDIYPREDEPAHPPAGEGVGAFAGGPISADADGLEGLNA